MVASDVVPPQAPRASREWWRTLAVDAALTLLAAGIPFLSAWIGAREGVAFVKMGPNTGFYLSGVAPLYEIEDGRLRVTYKPAQLKHAKEFFAGQKRFAHLTPAEMDEVDARVKKEWELLLAREKFDQSRP